MSDLAPSPRPGAPSRLVGRAAEAGLLLAVLVASAQWWVVSTDEKRIDDTFSGLQGSELTRPVAAAIDDRRLWWSVVVALSLALAAYLFLRWTREVTGSGHLAGRLSAEDQRGLTRGWFVPGSGQLQAYGRMRRLERATRQAGDALCDPLDTDRQSGIVLRWWWVCALIWGASFVMEIALFRRAESWFTGTSMWAVRMSLDTALVRASFTILAGIPLLLFMRWVNRTLAQ